MVLATAVLLRLLLLERDRVRRCRPVLAGLATCAPLLTLLYLPARTGRASFPDGLEDSDATIPQWISGTVPAPDAQALSIGVQDVLHHVAELGVFGLSQLSVAGLALLPLGLWSLRRDGVVLWCGVVPTLIVSGIAATTYGNYGCWHLPLLWSAPSSPVRARPVCRLPSPGGWPRSERLRRS